MVCVCSQTCAPGKLCVMAFLQTLELDTALKI